MLYLCSSRREAAIPGEHASVGSARVTFPAPRGAARFGFVAALFLTACNTTPPVVNDPSGGGQVSNTAPPPSAAVGASILEQLSLERMNRARLKPDAEAANNGIAIDEGIPGQLNTIPKPALALNAALNRSARSHSSDMLARDFFEHNNLSGQTPFQRMQAAGYAFITAGENLAWRGTTGTIDELQAVEDQHTDLFVDTGIDGRGHRVSMLNKNFREVGIGIVRGEFTRDGRTYDSIMQTQDFGTSPAGTTFVLGVVYNDVNRNGQYDYGEGAANSTVKLGDASKLTNAGGGYSFEVFQAGTYTLNFASHGRSTVLSIDVGDPNLKVDLVSGASIVINLGLGALN